MAKAPRKRAPAPKKGGAKSSPRPKSAKASVPKRAKAPAPKVARGSYEVICSECYSEFDFNPGTSASQITCPVCMHVGQVAEGADKSQFGIAKTRERSKFLAGLIPGILMFVVGFFWIKKLNEQGEELAASLNYGLLGATLILFVITVFTAAKYESARHEVYF